VFAIVGYPLAVIFDRDGMLFYFVRHVDREYLSIAYSWTVGSAILLIAFNWLFGSHRNFNKFMMRDTTPGVFNPDFMWWCVGICCALMNVYFFVLMDFSLPLFNLPDNVTELLLRRIEVKERLNPIMLNLNATVLGPLGLILSLFFVKRRKRAKVIVATANFLIIGTFSLAKSSFLVGVVIVILAYSFIRPLSKRAIVKVVLVFLLALVPMFLLTNSKQAPHVRGEAIAEIVMARIIYGQWAALPFFFEMFDDDRQSIRVLAPPYLADGSAWVRNGEEIPPRKVMRAVTGYRVLEGTGAGVAVTFFIGEAYAVGGEAGIIFGCIWVCTQIWMMTFTFSNLRKTPISIYLYSWLIYKVCMGLVTGMSAFILSSFTILLVFLFLLVMFGKMSRTWLETQRMVIADCSNNKPPVSA
jgi:hypothetical protein